MKNKPIRILHVLTAMNRAGAETMLMNLYRAIDREIIQFDFAVTTTENADYDDEIMSLGGRIIHYPRYVGKNHFEYKRWWKSFFKDHPEYRIVHGHIGSTAAIYLKIAKKSGCYTIAHSHSVGNHKTLHSFLYGIYSYRTRYIADYFIGCSKEALVSRYGKKVLNDKNRSYILKNGVDVKKYKFNEKVCEEVKKELQTSDEYLVVGTVGRFTEAKNVFFIIDVLSALKDKNCSFKFLWAGTGELEADAKKYIKEKDLQEEVLLLGVRDDIHRILQVLNVFILPSKFEGLPVIGVEAQAAGVPMLCSDRVSPDIKISDSIEFLNIDSVDIWVESILKETKFRRNINATENLISHGYDINSSASWLMNFYQEVV